MLFGMSFSVSAQTSSVPDVLWIEQRLQSPEYQSRAANQLGLSETSSAVVRKHVKELYGRPDVRAHIAKLIHQRLQPVLKLPGANPEEEALRVGTRVLHELATKGLGRLGHGQISTHFQGYAKILEALPATACRRVITGGTPAISKDDKIDVLYAGLGDHAEAYMAVNRAAITAEVQGRPARAVVSPKEEERALAIFQDRLGREVRKAGLNQDAFDAALDNPRQADAEAVCTATKLFFRTLLATEGKTRDTLLTIMALNME